LQYYVTHCADEGPKVVKRHQEHYRASNESKEGQKNSPPQPSIFYPMAESLAFVLNDPSAAVLFPNFVIVVAALVVIPMDNCEPERGFSIVKWIKSARRNKLGQAGLEQQLQIYFNGPSLDSKVPTDAPKGALSDLDKIIHRAAVLWYNGKSAKTGELVERVVNIPELQQSEEDKAGNPSYVWGQAFTETPEGVQARSQKDQGRRARRVARIEKLRRAAEFEKYMQMNGSNLDINMRKKRVRRTEIRGAEAAPDIGRNDIEQSNIVLGARMRFSTPQDSESVPASTHLRATTLHAGSSENTGLNSIVVSARAPDSDRSEVGEPEVRDSPRKRKRIIEEDSEELNESD
jgi:hypothetical protein